MSVLRLAENAAGQDGFLHLRLDGGRRVEPFFGLRGALPLSPPGNVLQLEERLPRIAVEIGEAVRQVVHREVGPELVPGRAYHSARTPILPLIA